jgi:galactokinase
LERSVRTDRPLLRERVEREFAAQFGGAATLMVRAPGRVNLIGEHTDYNDGFVLPVAIDRELWIALRPSGDTRVRAHSLEFGPAEISLDHLSREGDGWIEYIKGVAWALGQRGTVALGWDGVLGGDIPVGAGLSSSAALEIAVIRAFLALHDAPWNPADAALIGQRVENEWIGVQSGIMDQLVIAAGKQNHALLIDCRSLHVDPVPIRSGAIVVLDTGTRRGLVGSAYNERRRQCEEAAGALGVQALRDADLDRLQGVGDRLDGTAFRRARHVITENTRTLAAADALRTGDLATLGCLMNESHASLRDDFEVSTEALDVMADIAVAQPSCFGARMTGAGFGGCAVAMVEREQSHAFAEAVMRSYQAAVGTTCHAYVCDVADGASVAMRA